jgi:two-component system response regulator HydG
MSRGADACLEHAPSIGTILLVDDEPRLVRSLRRLLEPAGYDVRDATDRGAVTEELEREPQLILLDLQLGDMSGLELMRDIRWSSPDSEVIVMTGYGSVDSAVECMRAGAFDYLEKPFQDRHRVVQTLERALERRSLRVRNRELESELDQCTTLDGIVCQSPSMRRVVRTIRDLAGNESNVLIQAESGTGKELVARAIHETSPRSGGAFVPVDCGALPEGIAEGELFGYEKGAFTGASRAAVGLFRSATGGTLFLDEIGELPLLLQSKLLRALQEREVKPLGADSRVSVDVRIVAATNRDLAAEVRAGRFRSDLFYRLHVVSIELPALRERAEDIPPLVGHFMDRHAVGSRISGIEPDALELLINRRWDGNVRELENAVEAALALAPGPRLRASDLEVEHARTSRRAPTPDSLELSLDAYERACLEEALRQSGQDVRRAARLLGIGRSTLYRKLTRHGLSAAG